VQLRTSRVTRLAGIAGAGLVAALVLAAPTPAAAEGGPAIHIAGVRHCEDPAADEFTITWTVTTDSPDLLDVTVSSAQPTGSTHVSPSGGEIKDGQPLVLTHSVNQHAGPTASIELTVIPHGAKGDGITVDSPDLAGSCGQAPFVSVKGAASCDPAGKASVVWTVTNPGDSAVTASITNVLPAASSIAEGASVDVGAGASVPVHQSIPGTFGHGTASATFTVPYPQVPGVVTTVVGTVDYSCPAPAAAPSLPVTGSSTLAYVGIGAVLLVGGAGLIVLARRRRA
jgi:LPXTG-motif cell wall-anchored protein